MRSNPRLHRPALVIATSLAVFAVSSCGSDSNSIASPDLPVIEMVGGASSARSANADVMVASGAAESSKMMAPIVFEYAGDDVDLTSAAPAYRFVPSAVADDVVVGLAKAFGVEGDVRRLPDEQGGGLMIGPDDGTAPSVTVMVDAMQSWWFNDPLAGISASCVSVAVEPAPIDETSDATTDSTSDATSDATTGSSSVADDMPVECIEPGPPANVPGAAAGEQIVRDLLAEIGLDPAMYEFETYADEWGVSVTGFLLVDGVRSPLAVSVGVGGESRITWAGGLLATPERVAEYPRVGVAAAVERLNEQGGGWSAYGPAAVDPAVVDPAVVDPAVTESLTDSGSAEPAVVGEAPVDMTGGVEPFTVLLSDPQPALEQIWGVDDTVWLVPAYSFAGDDGGRYSALAIDDAYLQPVAPDVVSSPPPVPDTAVPGIDGGATEVPGATASSDAPDLVGRTFDEATAIAESAGWTVRVVRMDGEELAVTADYVSTRLNVAVEADVVTEVLSVG
jgi:hypothetical protein